MLTLYRNFRVLTATLLIFLSASVVGQTEVGEFGWSLTVSSKERKKKEKPSRQPVREEPTNEAGEIRIDTQLVLSDLLVQDENGVPVEGLTAADFEIKEDGVRQDIDLFVYGDSDVPRSIILVIDHSFSQSPFIDLSISAAKVLVDSMRPRDRMAIV